MSMDDDELRSALDTSQALSPQPRFLRENSARIPAHIALPPPPSFIVFSPSQSPSAEFSPPYHTAPNSPALKFYTPPTSPLDPIPSPPHVPPVLHISIPTSPVQNTDDPFPPAELPIDLALDDDGLSTLEKIYLFSRSKASFHRVFITHALPDFLHQVTPQEAIEYVLPLLSGLAMDEDEQVKEALAAKLIALIWWFFTHCKITPDEPELDHASSSALAAISVQAFTPILGTLLLSPNPRVGGGARYAIVNLLSRLRSADDREAGITVEIDEDEDEEWATRSFDREEREMFRNEILQQVVIGMGRLDADIEDPQVLTDELDDGQWIERNAEGTVEVVTAGEQGNGEEGVSSPREMERARSEAPKTKDTDTVNPYFPVYPLPFSVPSTASSAGSTPPSTDTLPSSSSSPGHLPGITSRKEAFSPSASTTSEYNYTLRDDSSKTARPVQTTLTEKPLSTLSPGDHTPSISLNPPGPPAVSATQLMPLSPTEETWAVQDHSPHILFERRQTNLVDLGYPTAYDIRQDYPEKFGSDEGEEDEQAAVGRLSSMSLMAAVTASGSLGEEMKEAFVKEVVRVGQDSVYWVRREASFALGALAKVVPEEVVICSLLPLFDTLRRDPVWHVRHSALFALPVILSRIPYDQRRSLALDTMMTLSTDEAPAVRFGVLEALGEVIYTFHQDTEGPPEKLLQLFLGRKEERRVRDGQQISDRPPSESLYDNPERPHVCAFNYPAVALTLGRERWHELRELYLDIAANRTIKVRRTLAASLGELAKIVGEENAQRDLMGVWWDAIRCEEEEVRTRAAGSVEELMTVVGREVGESMIRGLVTVWDEGVFRGWREREEIAKGLVCLCGGVGQQGRAGVVGLLKRALEDSVAAVREAGVGALPELWLYLSAHPEGVGQLRANLQSLAISTLFRRRMTFIACQQAIAIHAPLDDKLWLSLVRLADDPILGVRIGLARLVGSVSQRLPTSAHILGLVVRLSQDPSHDVQAYVLNPPCSAAPSRRRASDTSTFSRPPPLPAGLSLPQPSPNGIEESTTSFDGLRSYNGFSGGRSDADHPMAILPTVRLTLPLGLGIVPDTDSQHRLLQSNTPKFSNYDAMLEGTISSVGDIDADVNPMSSIVAIPA